MSFVSIVDVVVSLSLLYLLPPLLYSAFEEFVAGTWNKQVQMLRRAMDWPPYPDGVTRLVETDVTLATFGQLFPDRLISKH